MTSPHAEALAIARATAGFAKCLRRQVGAAVLSSDGRTLSTGRNGAPPGQGECTDGHCPRGQHSNAEVAPGSSYDTGPGSCISVHAEINALLYSDPVARLGGTLAVTHEPCAGCWRIIKSSGVRWVIWPDHLVTL